MLNFINGMMLNSKLWIGILFGLLFLVYSGKGAHGQNNDKPNILWIVSEDNSVSYVGTYGNELADTPNIDHLAQRSLLYENAFATTPVCAPARSTLITGMYSNAMGTENMRSEFPAPGFVQFFPEYLKEAGYYTTNNSKTDYNTNYQMEAWDESSDTASYKNRSNGQPFFHVKNLHETHESRIHGTYDTLKHDIQQVPVPPYLPDTQPVRRDIAHYYDKMTEMDARVGEILQELKASGEADNTIVFYYSDHGGVLPRSKRFMFESGLHVPLIVHIPEKYADQQMSTGRTDRLVSFVDFAPTVLSLAGIQPPEYMQGKAFLGAYSKPPPEYQYMNRGRMDERYDLIRTVRDKKYLYVRNYMPHRIYGQHINYLWKASSMQSWEEQYHAENLNETQRRFWEPKAAEELYKVSEDSHNINNLAGDPAYRDALRRMREANKKHLRKIQDLGFIPESMIGDIRGRKSLYEAVRDQSIPINKIIDTAEKASLAGKDNLEILADRLTHSEASVRYWAAMGLAIAVNKYDAKKYEDQLLKAADDSSPEVRLQVANALYRMGRRQKGLAMIGEILDKSGVYLKLEALNVMESLAPEKLSAQLKEKIQKLANTGDNSKGYVYRASKSILSKYTGEKSQKSF